ncbi:MAG: mitochondrial fission ELM1 family protein [Gammaproteobacteria bacterium]
MVIWQIFDDKPGHDNQNRGLVNALSRQETCHIIAISADKLRFGLLQLLLKHYPPGRGLPAPELIIGAGHGTHLSLLCARRAYGGHAVVIMQPGLPASWFDFCLIPQHDEPPEAGNIIITEGAINNILPSSRHDPALGLMLIGGPSRHYGWDDGEIMEQIDLILKRTPEITWRITDSRRTPPSTRKVLAAMKNGHAAFHPHEQTAPDWLPGQLAAAGQAWVSADSVSMIYEALTSGVATGLLSVPCGKENKLACSQERLSRMGLITDFNEWRGGKQLSPPAQIFDEASRCAGLILSRIRNQQNFPVA